MSGRWRARAASVSAWLAWLAVAALAGAAVLVSSAPAIASPTDAITTATPLRTPPAHRPAQVVAPKVEGTRLCGDVLEVDWDAMQLAGRDWRARLDDGTAVLDAHELSGRDWPAGHWVPVEYAADGGSRDNVLRWTGYGHAGEHGENWVDVRVQVAGYRSAAYPIREGKCG